MNQPLRTPMKVHYVGPPAPLNGTLCGKYPIVTSHIGNVTCGRCKRILAKLGYYGDFIFHLATEPARWWWTRSR